MLPPNDKIPDTTRLILIGSLVGYGMFCRKGCKMKQLTFKKTRPAHYEVSWGEWKRSVMIGYAETRRNMDYWHFVAQPNSPTNGGFKSATFAELERKMKKCFEKEFS